MKADLVILTTGTRTQAIIKDKVIGQGIKDLKFSATDKNGDFKPTLSLEIDVQEVEFKDSEELLKKLVDTKETLARIISEVSSSAKLKGAE